MDSYFARAPAEVRLLIYSHLFTHPKDVAIEIRNAGRTACQGHQPGSAAGITCWRSSPCCSAGAATRPRTTTTSRRPLSPFHQQQRYLPGVPAKARAGEQEKDSKNPAKDDEYYICAALMRVNRLIHEETSHLVYAQHSFDFGADMEAVEPFLSDLTPASRDMVRAISLYKRGPVAGYGFDSDRCEWRSVCRYLSKLLPASLSGDSSDGDEKTQEQQKQLDQLQRQHHGIRKIRLVVQCGKPPASYRHSDAGNAGPPREMSAEDFQLLADIKHESLDWVAELAQVGGIEELEIVPHVVHCPRPPTPT
ncbi:hypothetical protein PG997_006823 [Apiospora hydei]|uniref:Uncharacterized protein n=1 Tax=Apiospora hydei TaxID=1337664 RepID=A0ABR1WR79_9PEZI